MAAAWLAVIATPFAAAPTFACSCAMIEVGDLGDDPRAAVFSGLIAQDDDRGVPVIVDRWYRGADAAPVVWLDQAGFQDPSGASCGTGRPPTGTWWIFALGRDRGGPTLSVNLCTLQGQLGTPQGEEIAADVVQVFGPGEAIGNAQADPAADDASLWTGAAALLVGLGIVVAAALVWRGRSTDW